MYFPGTWEMVIIAVILVFIFGAKRLPEMGKSLGQGIREFKKSLTTDFDEDKDQEKIEEEKTKETKE